MRTDIVIGADIAVFGSNQQDIGACHIHPAHRARRDVRQRSNIIPALFPYIVQFIGIDIPIDIARRRQRRSGLTQQRGEGMDLLHEGALCFTSIEYILYLSSDRLSTPKRRL